MGTRPVGLFDVIIVNYRAYSRLERALESVYEWGGAHLRDVIVVDNESTISRLNSVRARFPQTIFLPQSRNLGFSKAVNLALRKVGAQFVMLLNPDAYLTGPLLEGALAFFQSHPQCAVVGPKVLDPEGEVQGSARWDPTLTTAFFGRSGPLTRYFPRSRFVERDVAADRALEGGEREVHWVSGACMLVRVEAIEEIGPMDEAFFLYWEDCDWCKRFRERGWRIFYAPKIGAVVHECGKSSQKRPFRSLFQFHKSAFLLYRKYDRTPLKLGSALVFLGAVARFLVISSFFRKNG